MRRILGSELLQISFFPLSAIYSSLHSRLPTVGWALFYSRNNVPWSLQLIAGVSVSFPPEKLNAIKQQSFICSNSLCQQFGLGSAGSIHLVLTGLMRVNAISSHVDWSWLVQDDLSWDSLLLFYMVCHPSAGCLGLVHMVAGGVLAGGRKKREREACKAFTIFCGSKPETRPVQI